MRLNPLHADELCHTLCTQMSFALSLMLVFRTNSSYARWVEARALWSVLVSDGCTPLLGLRHLLLLARRSQW